MCYLPPGAAVAPRQPGERRNRVKDSALSKHGRRLEALEPRDKCHGLRGSTRVSLQVSVPARAHVVYNKPMPQVLQDANRMSSLYNEVLDIVEQVEIVPLERYAGYPAESLSWIPPLDREIAIKQMSDLSFLDLDRRWVDCTDKPVGRELIDIGEELNFCTSETLRWTEPSLSERRLRATAVRKPVIDISKLLQRRRFDPESIIEDSLPTFDKTVNAASVGGLRDWTSDART